jgi:hypothetical protein
MTSVNAFHQSQHGVLLSLFSSTVALSTATGRQYCHKLFSKAAQVTTKKRIGNQFTFSRVPRFTEKKLTVINWRNFRFKNCLWYQAYLVASYSIQTTTIN